MIRAYRDSDFNPAVRLIADTYRHCNSREGRRAAVDHYCAYFSEKNDRLRERFAQDIIFVAIRKRMVGIIRASEGRVINLFVNPSEQRKGIGHALLERAEAELQRRGEKEIRIRSSLFGVRFYAKNGYKRTTGVREFHGLKIQPMKKRV